MTQKIFLIECSSSAWLKTVDPLRKAGIEIALWSAWSQIKAEVLESVPGVVFQDTRHAKIGRPEILTPQLPFTAECETIWRSEAHTVFEMMSRFDHSRDLTYVEMAVLFHQMLSYWNAVLDKHMPELVVFSTPPHVVYDYIILCLCRHKYIPTLMFEEATILPPYSLAFSDYMSEIPDLKNAYNALRTEPVDDIPEAVTRVVEKIQKSYQDAIPEREKIARKGMSKFDNLETFTEESLKRIDALKAHDARAADDPSIQNPKVVNTSSWVKQRGVPLRHSFADKFGNSQFAQQCHDEQFVTLDRARFYKTLCQPVDTLLEDDRPFVYFNLAGQPERTSCPQAHIFSNQFVVAGLLSEYLPANWRVLIKEHPNQLNPNFFANMCRTREYYEYLAQMPRTFLVNIDAPQFDLIDRCGAVVTTGGTCALEAVIRGKNSLVFGQAWYRDCPGMTTLKSPEEAKSALAKIDSLVRPKLRDIELYLTAVTKVGFLGIADVAPDEFKVSDLVVAKNLSKKIVQFAEKSIEQTRSKKNQRKTV